MKSFSFEPKELVIITSKKKNNVCTFQHRFQACMERQQVAQLSQRDRAAGWVSNGQKWKTGTERQYLWTI